MKNRERIISQVLFICVVIVLLHAVFISKEKCGLNLDEAISFQFANDGVIHIGTVLDVIRNGSVSDYSAQLKSDISGINTWVSHSEILDEYTASKSSKFNLFSAYLINAGDVHPPFYYTCLNLLSSIFPKFSIYTIGLIINIFALIVACIFMYLIAVKVFGSRVLALISAMYYGLSFEFINSATLFRMYALLTMWCIMLVYLYISWYESGFDFSSNIFRKICVVEFMAMFTQYFALFYIVPLFIITIIVMYMKKASIKKYFIGNVVTGVIYLIVWPFFLMHVVFSDRGHDVTGNLSGGSIIRRIYSYRTSVIKGMFANNNKLFLCFILISVIVVMFYAYSMIHSHNIKEKVVSKRNVILVYSFVPALFYFFIAACSVPWFVDRYIMPVMPIFSIMIVFFIYKALIFIIKNKNICAVLLTCLVLFMCGYWHQNIEPYYIYDSADRLAYKATCKNTDAIVLDVDYEVVNYEVETNFEHPNILEMDSNHISDIGSMIDKNDDYTLYVRKEKIEDSEVEDYFDSLGYKMDVVDFDTDFYKIYQLHH
ncbi:Dolichyl-phosphate-mannose-protein mannosyltransferase [Pseudobutyrivibrio sp. UC1225]|uniref:hypothetical protein n=1 Tax=Pseudobutyrivibrio sp. UC1225 TaxID=1798185 RepID=UPI0008EFC7A8|nr:hypothetical protein [Pseudobutyrivibrio sp. UC1225]SFN44163.1 Dolichyl-phosphate-mannose-protein mannosyltransferase [Pseudobutyrivibrio sp. UC1225]